MKVLRIVISNAGGILLVDKSCGVSSFDVVRMVRKLAKIKRVGHAGTLDMGASGLLIVALGKATKLISIFQDLPKKYITEILFGKKTDTDDMTGEVIAESDFANDLLKARLPRLIENYQGEIEQIAPVYSALKIDGKRSSDLARQGIVPKVKKRIISIYDILLQEVGIKTAILSIACSKGTYIRSIARDLGNDLEIGGTVKTLRRLSIGDFTVENSIVFADLNADNIDDKLISIQDALYMAESIIVSIVDQIRVLNGIVTETIKDNMHSAYAIVLSEKGELIAILRKNDGSISFITVFH